MKVLKIMSAITLALFGLVALILSVMFLNNEEPSILGFLLSGLVGLLLLGSDVILLTPTNKLTKKITGIAIIACASLFLLYAIIYTFLPNNQSGSFDVLIFGIFTMPLMMSGWILIEDGKKDVK